MAKRQKRGRDPLGTEAFAGMHKALKPLLVAAVKAGGSVTRCGSGHLQIRVGDPAKFGVLTIATTSSGPEHEAKLLRQRLRQRGVDV